MRELRAFCTLLVLTSLTSGLVAHADNDRSAKLTEKHGDVYKRGFIDWTRQEWGDPAPAHLGEQLAEGMQLGTGNKSRAQLTPPVIENMASPTETANDTCTSKGGR